jgi:hypothetical protein
MQVLVLQHIACEPPGVYEDVLRGRGADIHRVGLDENDPLPRWQGFDAIIAIGGPMSANDEEILPWLRDEKALISEAVRAGEVGLLPVFLTPTRLTTGFLRAFRVSFSPFSGTATRSRYLLGRCCWLVRRPSRTRRFVVAAAPMVCNFISRFRRTWPKNGWKCRNTRKHYARYLVPVRRPR